MASEYQLAFILNFFFPLSFAWLSSTTAVMLLLRIIARLIEQSYPKKTKANDGNGGVFKKNTYTHNVAKRMAVYTC